MTQLKAGKRATRGVGDPLENMTPEQAAVWHELKRLRWLRPLKRLHRDAFATLVCLIMQQRKGYTDVRYALRAHERAQLTELFHAFGMVPFFRLK
jgi:hypothetical protein